MPRASLACSGASEGVIGTPALSAAGIKTPAPEIIAGDGIALKAVKINIFCTHVLSCG